MNKDLGAHPASQDRATQASPEAPAGLRHSVSVPCAGAFTPGPWEADEQADVLTQSGGLIATVYIAGEYTRNGDEDEAKRDANARLIAAAPDLYAQLEFAVKLLSAFPGLNASAQVEAMRAALSRATGADRLEQALGE